MENDQFVVFPTHFTALCLFRKDIRKYIFSLALTAAKKFVSRLKKDSILMTLITKCSNMDVQYDR